MKDKVSFVRTVYKSGNSQTISIPPQCGLEIGKDYQFTVDREIVQPKRDIEPGDEPESEEG